MRLIFLFILCSLGAQFAQSQAYANDENYYLIILDGEEAYVNKNTGEVVKANGAQPKPAAPVLNDRVYTSSSTPTMNAIHVVSKGDTLYSIARKYGLSVDALCQMNGISKSSILAIGQRIRVANQGAGNSKTTNYTVIPTHTVKKGETLYRIARENNTTVSQIKHLNQLSSNTIHPGMSLRVK